jgi:hypothetical protein
MLSIESTCFIAAKESRRGEHNEWPIVQTVTKNPNCLPLWAVIAKVRPKHEHPWYYDWQHGFLIVVIYAKDHDAAADITTAIIE